MLGHAYLLLAGFAWAIAMMHTRKHVWRGTPLDALPWQMSVAATLFWPMAAFLEPFGHLEPDKWQLWVALIYIGIIAGPAGTWTTVSVTRALPPLTTSLGMLGVPLVGIVSSVLLLGEKFTLSLAAGAALVLAGMAIVILDRN